MEVVNLRAYCANIGIEIRDFCKKLDVHPAYLSRVINGKSPGSAKLAKLVYHETGKLIKIPFKKKKNCKWQTDDEFWAA